MGVRRDVGAGARTSAADSVLGNLATAQVLTANYADTRHFGLRPTWQLTGKLRLQGQLEYIDRRFGNDPVPASKPTARMTMSPVTWRSMSDWPNSSTLLPPLPAMAAIA